MRFVQGVRFETWQSESYWRIFPTALIVSSYDTIQRLC